jgi:hypothetical protein
LNPQNGLANLATAVIDDRGLPITMALLQLFKHGPGEPKFGQCRLELIVALQLLPLLSRHVRFEEDFRRIDLLCKDGERRREQREDGEEKQPDFVHRQDRR